jgi:formylglycine-generating enzyme required for sulfatase activity
MANKKYGLPLITGLCLLIFFASCTPKAQPAPTPDAGMIATQMWIDLSVEQTLAASLATETPLPTAGPTATPTSTFLSTPLPAPADPMNPPPTYNQVNGMELVYVPAGEFLMGASEFDSDLEEHELPQHTVYLDAFWMSKIQITNTMFNACVSAGACDYSVSHTTNSYYLNPNFASHPVVYVSWDMAQTYCQWTGGRLPSEAEWEKAARGPDGARYAWGEDRPRSKFVNAGNEFSNTTIVGILPYGQSYYGAFDMGGNVREWVYDWYDADYFDHSTYRNPMGPETGEKKVLKGASYSDIIRYARASNRLSHEPESPGLVRGFRCAYP